MLVLLTNCRRSLRLLRLRANTLEVLLQRTIYASRLHDLILATTVARIVLLLVVLLVQPRDIQVDRGIV